MFSMNQGNFPKAFLRNQRRFHEDFPKPVF